ncbi:MAG TPA: DNA translocase FtsK 4TM domain-containing protein, partial [Myxococcota bacterium]|nr:DNA translocase FtsK 4TM domain-containing protein [Myxococcota bacterium]
MSRRTSEATSVMDTVQRTFSEHRRELAHIGVWAACAFVVISLLGWRETDPTWSHPDLSGRGVLNPCGPLGANVADVLLRALGVGAWVSLAGLVVPVLSLARRELGAWWRWALAAWQVVVLLGLVELAFGPPGEAEMRPGGALGALVALALVDVVGRIGAWLVLLASSLGGAGVLLGVSWTTLAQRAVQEGEARL